jgi:hypothetical protein
MMWGPDYPHSESTFPQSRKILAEILEGVPNGEQATAYRALRDLGWPHPSKFTLPR